MTDNIVLWIFTVAILANVYSLYTFWQAMRAFTESQLQLNELIKRMGKSVMTHSSPDTTEAIERLNKIADCFVVDGTRVDAYGRFELTYGDLRALRAALPDAAATPRLREALEFGIWSVSGPINDQETERLEKQIEKSWQDFLKQKAIHSPDAAERALKEIQQEVAERPDGVAQPPTEGGDASVR